MKITGVKKAVGTYKRANSGGYYRSSYGALMVDMSKVMYGATNFQTDFRTSPMTMKTLHA